MAEYIDREKLIADFEQGCYDGVILSYEDTIELIKKQPAADVAPVVHGYWKKDKECIYQCSECKRLAVPTQYGQHLGKYCPNCGAKVVL